MKQQQQNALTPSRQGETSAPRGQERLAYLDWLRLFAVLGVFYAHAAWLFDLVYSWRIEETGNAYALVVFANQWGMALFFVLAGASAWFSLTSRTARQFLRERVARLLLPLLAGLLLIAVPQAYFMDRSHSLYHGPFLPYAVQYLTHLPLGWNPQSLVGYGFHLWFLVVLLLATVLTLPLLISLRRERGQRFVWRLAVFCQRRGGLFLLGLPLVLLQVALRPLFPGYQGWADVVSWLVYFVAGSLFVADPRIQKAIWEQWLPTACIVVASSLTIMVMFGPGSLRSWSTIPSYSLAYELGQFLFSITSWALTLLALSLGMHVFKKMNRFVRYANEAVLPFYVLHVLLIAIVTFLVLPWEMPMGLRFALVTTLALAATLLVYDVLVKRIRVVRRAFGMRPIRQIRESSHPASSR